MNKVKSLQVFIRLEGFIFYMKSIKISLEKYFNIW
jgi:hypothetical protein